MNCIWYVKCNSVVTMCNGVTECNHMGSMTSTSSYSVVLISFCLWSNICYRLSTFHLLYLNKSRTPKVSKENTAMDSMVLIFYGKSLKVLKVTNMLADHWLSMGSEFYCSSFGPLTVAKNIIPGIIDFGDIKELAHIWCIYTNQGPENTFVPLLFRVRK